MNKVFESAAAAVSDIWPGATVAVAGFGMNYRFPNELIDALVQSGTSRLHIVCNSLGEPGVESGHALIANRQVDRLTTSFSARPKVHAEVEDQIRDGLVELELVAQGCSSSDCERRPPGLRRSILP